MYDDNTVVYKGKTIKVESKENFMYIIKAEAINDTQVAISLRQGKNVNTLLVYDVEKEKYIAEKEGSMFKWYKDDITTLVYANTSNVYEGYYEICDYKDKVLYTGKKGNEIVLLEILEKGKLKLREVTPEEYVGGNYVDDENLGTYQEIDY